MGETWVERLVDKQLGFQKELAKYRKKYEREEQPKVQRSVSGKFESLFPELREIDKTQKAEVSPEMAFEPYSQQTSVYNPFRQPVRPPEEPPEEPPPSPPIDDINQAIAHMKRASATHTSDSAWDKEWRSHYADITDRLNEVAGGEVDDHRISSAISHLIWDIKADRKVAQIAWDKGEKRKSGYLSMAAEGYQEIIDLLLPLVTPETRIGLEKIAKKEFQKDFYAEVAPTGKYPTPFMHLPPEEPEPPVTEEDKLREEARQAGETHFWYEPEKKWKLVEAPEEPFLSRMPFEAELEKLGEKPPFRQIGEALESPESQRIQEVLGTVGLIGSLAFIGYAGAVTGWSQVTNWTLMRNISRWATANNVTLSKAEAQAGANAIRAEAQRAGVKWDLDKASFRQLFKPFKGKFVPTPEAAQKVEKMASDAVQQYAPAIIPRGTQTGAMAFGGVGKPAQIIKTLPTSQGTALLKDSQEMGKKIGLDVEAIGGISGGEYWVSVTTTSLKGTDEFNEWAGKFENATELQGKLIGKFEAKLGAKEDEGFGRKRFLPFKNIQDAKKFLDTGDTSLIATRLEFKGLPRTEAQRQEALDWMARGKEVARLAEEVKAKLVAPPEAVTPTTPVTPEVTKPVSEGVTTSEMGAESLTATIEGFTDAEEYAKSQLAPKNLSNKISNTYLYRIQNILSLDNIIRKGVLEGLSPAEAHRSILKEHPEYRKEWEESGITEEDETWGIDEQETKDARLYFTQKENTGYKGDLLLRVKREVADEYGGELVEDIGLPNEFFYDGAVGIPIENIEVKIGSKWVPLRDYPNIKKGYIDAYNKSALKPPAVEVKAPEKEVARLAEQLKAKLATEPPPVKPEPELTLVARRTELTEMLATPAKELPKGVTKIELRQELKGISAKLVPQEKKLRQQIMAQVKTLGLPQSQYREIFRNKGGSRWLTQVNMERLPRVLEAVKAARPVSIKGKKVITPRIEREVLARKEELIDEGILTGETYKDILKTLKLPTDKYVSKELFITQTEAHSILREMNNRAILAPLGELKFGKPTAIKYLTSQVYYSQVLGVKPLTEPLELAKVDFDLAYRAMSQSIDNKLREVNKLWKTKKGETLRDLLDKTEEAPAGLTAKQKELFNWFRNLNRTIINGENEVRRAMGVEEISYRQAYVRHIPDTMAWEIINGTHPIPPSLTYWSRRLVSKKIFNPMELHRELSDDLAKLYSKDLAYATKNMVYTGLKEIHLAQPLRAFTERMGALSDVMPAQTRKWVTDYINQVIKGQQTEWDESINALVTESGVGGLINKTLKPLHLTLGQRPVTRLATVTGKGTIFAVLGLPRPRLARLMIRNTFQRTQELALHGVTATLKSFLPDPKALKALKAKSRFLKSYTGVEEWPADLMGKLAKIPLAPYQFTAVLNADRGMSVAYYDYLKFFTNKKYKDLGWASGKRTYKEEKGFLYPEEQELMLSEMELATRANQYQYIGMGMPEIFRNKTLIPITRLQSWWMNYFTMFLREGFHRFAYGETMSKQKLPWASRLNWLKYLLLGGAILTGMGYTRSYLWKVLPHNESPVAQLSMGLVKYVSADSDWERAQAKRDIIYSWKAVVPGPMAYDEFQKLWSGEMPLWQMFFYGREEEEMPPRPPTWGIINRQPAIDRKTAKRDIGEAEGLLGQTVPKEMPDPYHYIDEVTGEYKLYTYPKEEYVYEMNDLGAVIRRATLKLEDKDITEETGFSPLTLYYKQSELLWDRFYYSLPGEGSYRADFFKTATSESVHTGASLVLWGKLGLGSTSYIGRNPKTAIQVKTVLRELMEKYNIPDEAVPALAKEAKEQKPAPKPSPKAETPTPKTWGIKNPFRD